jgi:DNA polymerase
MPDIITVDFETFYDKDYSLSKMSTEAYVNDPRYETIGVGVKVNDGETTTFTGPRNQTAAFLAQYDWENSWALAHNALFDATILAYRFNIHPKLLLDTLSMARAIHGTEVGGSLAKLSNFYGVGEKGTEVMNALGKRRLQFRREEIEAYMLYCANDVDLTYEIFKRMAPCFNKSEIKLIDMTLRMHTQPRMYLDPFVLKDHLHEVKEKKEELMARVTADKSELMSNPKFAEALLNLGVEPPMKVSARTGKETFAFAKSDEGMKALLDHEDPNVQALVAARLGVKSTLEETRTERFIDLSERFGKLPVPLKYYGAMTGRWAATDKTNLQNLPRGSKLKEAIIAPEGWKIVGADLSNIELRVGLYFAGQMDKLKLLADGVDLYKDFASDVFGVDYDDVDDDQRFIGKTSQLSLIYGTGHKKLRNQIKLMSGKDIGEKEAKRIVDFYRSDYTKVVESWSHGETALRAILNNMAYMFGVHPKLEVMGKAGIQLPSEMFLQYPDLQLGTNEAGKKEWTYAQRKERIKIHGPKCYQNAIQALARCVMGESMVRVHKRIPVALTIHDALYCVVPDQIVNKVAKFIIEELKREPEWAPGLPLDAEIGAGQSLAFKMKKLEAFLG